VWVSGPGTTFQFTLPSSREQAQGGARGARSAWEGTPKYNGHTISTT
jgi:hypothetical protein